LSFLFSPYLRFYFLYLKNADEKKGKKTNVEIPGPSLTDVTHDHEDNDS